MNRFLIYDLLCLWLSQVASFPLLYALACWVLSGSKLTIRFIRDIVCRVVEMSLFNLNKIDAEIASAVMICKLSEATRDGSLDSLMQCR